MQYASYKITLDDGTVIEGGLNIGGFVEISNMPVGQYKLVLGEDTREYSDSGIYPTGTMPSNAMIKQNCRGILSKLANNDTESLKAHYHGAAKAGSWSFGILQQDFNSEVSVENVLIAAIADPGFTTESAIIARDVTAHIMYLAENPNDNNDNDWLKLFLFISAEPIKAFGSTLTYVSADRFSAALSTLRRLRYGDPVGFISNLVYADFKPTTISPRVIAKHLYYACFAILENETMQQKLGPHCIEKINDVYPEKLQNLADILEKGIERGIEVFEKRTTESLALYQEAYPHHGIAGFGLTAKAPVFHAPELSPLKGAKAYSGEEKRSLLPLEYFYLDGEAVEEIQYKVTDQQGNIYQGQLSAGTTELIEMPLGHCEIEYCATTDADEQELIKLRADLVQSLDAIVEQVKQKAAIEDAIFEEASFFEQWAIETGARMQGLYDGAESLVTGTYSLVKTVIELNGAAYQASYRLIKNLATGNTAAIKRDLETILETTNKQLGEFQQAFELLVTVLDDADTALAIGKFPYDYIEA